MNNQHQNVLRRGTKRVVALMISLMMVFVMMPQMSFAASGAEPSVDLITTEITTETTSIDVKITNLPSAGILRVIQLDSGDSFQSSKLNDYTSLNFSLLANLHEGENSLALSGAPTEGKQLMAVMRDSTGVITDYMSKAVTVVKPQSGTDDPVQDDSDLSISINGDVTTSATSIPVTISGNVPAGSTVTIRGYAADHTQIDYSSAWLGNGEYNWNIGTLLDAASGEQSVQVTGGSYLVSGLQLVAYVLNDGSPIAHSAITVVKGSGSIADQTEAIMNNCSVKIVHDGDFAYNEKSAHVTATLDPSLETATLTLYACPGNVAFSDMDTSPFVSVASREITGSFDGDMEFAKALPAQHRLVAVIRAKIADTDDGGHYGSKVSNYVNILDENGQAFTEYTYPDITIDEETLEAGATSLHLTLTGDPRLFGYAQDPNVDFQIYYAVGMYPEGETFDFEGGSQIGLINHVEASAPFVSKEVSFTEPLREGYRVRAVAYWTENRDIFVPKGNDYESNQADDSVPVTAKSNDPKLELSDIYVGDTSCDVTVSGIIPEGAMMSVKSFSDGTEPAYDKGEVQKFFNSVNSGTTTVEFGSSDKLTENTVVVAYLLVSGDPVAQSKPVTVKKVPAPEVSLGKITTESTSIPVTIKGKVAEGSKLLLFTYAEDATEFPRNYSVGTWLATASENVAAGEMDVDIDNTRDGFTEGRQVVAFLVDSSFNDIASSEPSRISVKTEEPAVSIVSEVSTDSTAIDVEVSGGIPEESILLVKSYDKNVTEFRHDAGEAHGVTSGIAVGTVNHKLTNTDKLAAGRKLVAFVLSVGEPVAQSEAVVVKQGAYSTPVVTITDKKLTAGMTKLTFKAEFDKALDSAAYSVYSFSGEAFNAESATDLDLSGSLTRSDTKSVYIAGKISSGDIKVGDKLVVALTAGGETVYSEPIEVQASPGWTEPTSSFTVDAVDDNAAEIPIKVDFDDRYLTMDDFYCNVSVYMFDRAIDDDIFEEEEYWEKTDKVKCVARANYSASEQVKGEFSIPVLESANLTAGKKLIIKVRVPHQEWEGEEMDYLSSSVLIKASSAFATGPSVLLYNVDFSTDRGATIRDILDENHIAYKVVTKDDYNQKIGYLVERKGFSENTEAYTGEGSKSEFLLMNAADSDVINSAFIADDTGLIDLMAAEDVSIPHKAIVTDTNQDWTLGELIERIADEHSVMTGWMDLYNLDEVAKDYKEEEYGGTDAWTSFQKAKKAAEDLLAEEDEDALTEEALNAAAAALEEAINNLTANEEFTANARTSLRELADKESNYSEAELGKNSNWPAYSEALQEAKKLLNDDSASAGAMSLAADKLSKAMKKLDRVKSTQAVAQAKDKIAKLPDTDKLTAEDAAAVEAAKAAFDALTPEQQEKIDPADVAKLNDAVARIAELKGTKPETKPANAKKNQTIKLSAKTKTLKASELRKKARTVKPIKIKSAKGKVRYKVVSGSKKAKKALKLNKKNGKIKVKKKTPKGTYKLKIRVTAAGYKNYKAATKTVTVKIKVK